MGGHQHGECVREEGEGSREREVHGQELEEEHDGELGDLLSHLERELVQKRIKQ